MRTIVFAMALLIAGCSAFIRPTHISEDEISIKYDAIASSLERARARAAEHCATTDRTPELVNQWTGLGHNGATFRCI